MKIKDLYWLAGILEGEGSFMKGTPSAPNLPRISCSMTDEDTIQKVSDLMMVKYHKCKLSDKNPKWKDTYIVNLRGKRARELMGTLKPIMGKRRQAQIQRALDSYDPDKSLIKLSKDDVSKIKVLLKKSELTHKEIASKFNVERSTISFINTGRIWKDTK